MRAAILDASCRIGEEEGESGLTMRNIAGRVGVSATMLYGYFADKAALLLALQERVREEFLTRLSADLASVSDPIEHLLRLCTSYVALAQRSPWVYVLAFGDLPLTLLHDPSEGTDPFVTRATPHLSRLSSEPILSAVHLRVAVHGLASALAQHAHGRGPDASTSGEGFAEAHFRLWLAGLGAATDTGARIERPPPTSEAR